MSTNSKDLSQRLAAGADDAPAILAPGRPALTHGGCATLIAATAERLHALGIGRGDRVAIVLPNGPEMATAFVAVAAGATTAPLNPAYRADELDFYLTDIGAKAILVVARRDRARRWPSPSGSASPSCGLRCRPGRTGRRLHHRRPRAVGAAGRAGYAGRTTSRCSCTPPARRRGRSWCRSATPTSRPRRATSARRSALTPHDRCLNIMPLFHIHGLIAAVLSSLAAGGSVFCTPGFNALRFFRWLGEADADLVHGGADHASGDPGARRAQRRDASRRRPAALHPLVLGVAAAAGDGGAGGRRSAAR